MLFKISMKEYLRFIPLLIFILTGCRDSQKSLRELVSENSIEVPGTGKPHNILLGNGRFIFIPDLTGLQSSDCTLGTSSIIHTGTDEKAHAIPNVCMVVFGEDGKRLSVNEFKRPLQNLNLWTAELKSRFEADGVPVSVQTVCHPDYDMISVRIVSGLLMRHRIMINIKMNGENFTSPNDNQFAGGRVGFNVMSDSQNVAMVKYAPDGLDHYLLLWKNSAELTLSGNHELRIDPVKIDSVYSFSFLFMEDTENGRVQNFGETLFASSKSWEKYWTSPENSSVIRQLKSSVEIKRVLFELYREKLKIKQSGLVNKLDSPVLRH